MNLTSVYTPAGTRILIPTESVPDNTEIVTCSVTWYVKFKGPYP